ncbi:MAG: Rieske 2Fe-2S domain-containing protein [Anaerolineae bacterium]|nr:Rieske 2Fe-2S domain-containing protein [Anaerolineae bacterium]
MTEINDTNITRRDFLKTAWSVIGGITALEAGALAIAYMQPRLAEGEFGGVLTIGAVEDFPPGSVTHITDGRFYLTRFEDGGFVAIYQRCTHLGCSVPWEQTENMFICPCHNSQFTSDGDVLNPPAPRPLDLFAVSIEEGIVKVDTGNLIVRDQFDPAHVAYAAQENE